VPEVKELVTSADFHQLMTINAACVAQRQHNWMRGKSPVPSEPLTYLGAASTTTTSSSSSSKASSSKPSSSRSSRQQQQQLASSRSSRQQQQQLAIPTHHEALLIALGLRDFNCLTLPGRSSATSDEHNSYAVAIAAVHACIIKRRDSAAAGPMIRHISSGIVAPAAPAAELALPGLSGTGLALPFALLLVEGLLLAPTDVEVAGTTLSMLILALQAYHADSMALQAYHADSMALQAYHADSMAETRLPAPAPELLQAVLQCAAPSVLHTLAEVRPSGVKDTLMADEDTKDEMMHNLATLVMRLAVPGGSSTSVVAGVLLQVSSLLIHLPVVGAAAWCDAVLFLSGLRAAATSCKVTLQTVYAVLCHSSAVPNGARGRVMRAVKDTSSQ
jgi:hypothetical protein